MKRKTFDTLIENSAFQELFITEMGWNKPSNTQPVMISIDDMEYEFVPISEKRGFQVYTCTIDKIPNPSECKKIDNKLRNFGYDYICIFVQKGSSHHLWLTPVKTNEKRDLVKTEYDGGAKADFLFSKIDDLSFGLDEVVLITDVKQRVQGSFHLNSEKITKDFYAQFKKEHKKFAGFIVGIDDEKDKNWYASIMLNRLMFCYFIQKKRFFDNNVNYLQDKLKWVKIKQGEDQFFETFYKGFLCALFHDGLNSPRHDDDFVEKYGRIPYLNGGMFDDHQLEREHSGIDIDDEAFENLFDFFDKWNWHLDTRITASGKDINPDVLGYIFEQYINDRAAMGAYYTKEDITEYIGKNCIIPFLMDKTASSTKDAKKDFEPDGFVWSMLKESGDKYIYDAVKKGYSSDWKENLPDYISVGIDTKSGDLLQRRSRWNEKTFDEFALPTEIWRETVERLQRCENLINKISSGEITSINDFITYNLDIRQFAEDSIRKSPDHSFIAHFYRALQNVTILDPTCGSGAFLFAALNILEPLYEACIDRMEEFHAKNNNLFVNELEEINAKYSSNRQYFIYKSIILRNLYGVDIMVEATEIAKLRLFLKMVAVVEVDRKKENLGLDPLPDIDFNIKCGNSLVGYATEEELKKALEIRGMFEDKDLEDKITSEMQLVAKAYSCFRSEQLKTYDDNASIKKTKEMLRDRLAKLNDLLNHHMHQNTSGVDDYENWLKRTQPFHWLAEYYQIIHDNGGFDVIVGNPPYVTFTDLTLPYNVSSFNTYPTKNLFALVGERCITISNKLSGIGYIIPLSGMSIEGFEKFQKIIYKNKVSWNSYYSGDRNPAELFTGVKIRAGIYISHPLNNSNCKKYVTKYLKYYSNEREYLFSKIRYVDSYSSVSAPKLDGNLGKSVIKKIIGFDKSLSTELLNESYIYYHAAPIHWSKSLIDLSILEKNGLNIADSYKKRSVSKLYKDFTFDVLNSTMFFYFWIVFSDCYNLTQKYFSLLKVPLLKDDSEFKILADRLNKDLIEKMQIAEYSYKNKGSVRFAQFFPKLSKPIIDEIDKVLAKHYGFTEEELDFIINYDIKYRMGDELSAEE
ncbi:MAG: DNA methyltransferase [Paludibacteraceae bacterium]|nr:DNA methyltransferase [Paludibacteraceae bacterium]